MAGIVNEEWTWDVNVKKGSSNQQNIKVVAWDADSSTALFTLTTDANGNIAQQELQQAIHSITGTSTLSTDDKTPHVLAFLDYGIKPTTYNISFIGPRVDTFFVADDANVVTVEGTISGYTDINVNNTTDTITLSTSRTLQIVYDRTQYIAWNSPDKNYPLGGMTTVDGNTFTSEYDIVVNAGVTLDGDGKTVSMQGVKDITVNTTGNLTDITVNGNVEWGTGTTLTDLNVTGTINFPSAGTYILDNCTINVATADAAVTLQLTNGSSVADSTDPDVTVSASYNHVVEGLELNTEVTYVTADTSTELFHVENATTSDGNGKYKTTYVHSGGATVDILIHNVQYEPDVSNIYGLTLPSNDATVKVQMFFDDNYENPA